MTQSITPQELLEIVTQSIGRSPMPYLHDPAVRERSIQIARSQGLFERIESELTPATPIRSLTYSEFRQFRRYGKRSDFDTHLRVRQRQITTATMACYLGVDRLEYLQDLLWADCELTQWVSPAHESHADHYDLWTAMMGRSHATILALLGDRMEEEVRTRLAADVQRRVIDVFLDPKRQHYWWKTTSNNWNAVCHCGVAYAAMFLEKDPLPLAAVLAMVLRDVQKFIDGFTDDGGCSEGPSYWRYGFGWYAALAAGLHDFTGGRIDLMAGEKIRRICRYPLATAVRPGVELKFADANSGFQSPETTILINRFHPVPELFGMCKLTADGSLVIDSLQDLMLYDGTKYSPVVLTHDEMLGELGLAKVYSGPLAVGAKAGHNDEHHNHNDVGSFIVYRNSTAFLADPGGPIYSARTFNQHRYESVFTNSLGHSVPVVDGASQSPGRQFSGKLTAAGLNGGGGKSIQIELGGAYDCPSLGRLGRTIDVPPGGSEIRLTDRFDFLAPPQSVQEVFITMLAAAVSADGKSVKIPSESDGSAVLTAGAEGVFAVQELVEESQAESPLGELLRRITFTPAALAERMELGFTLRFE